MIENPTQYGITTKRLSKFKEAVSAYDINEAVTQGVSTVLAEAELEALKSEVDVLSAQVQEYESGCVWETSEDGGDHVHVDSQRLLIASHPVGDCPEGCPLAHAMGEEAG